MSYHPQTFAQPPMNNVNYPRNVTGRRLNPQQQYNPYHHPQDQQYHQQQQHQHNMSSNQPQQPPPAYSRQHMLNSAQPQSTATRRSAYGDEKIDPHHQQQQYQQQYQQQQQQATMRQRHEYPTERYQSGPGGEDRDSFYNNMTSHQRKMYHPTSSAHAQPPALPDTNSVADTLPPHIPDAPSHNISADTPMAQPTSAYSQQSQSQQQQLQQQQLLQQALAITPQESIMRSKLRTLSIHSWYQCDTPQMRQTSFSKSKIAFPVLSSLNLEQISQIQLQNWSQRRKEEEEAEQQQQTRKNQLKNPFAPIPKFIPLYSQLPPDRRRDTLFDATARIISNDITHNTWSRSIQCLLSQSCDCVFTFIHTLCYYHKVLQVVMKNRDRVMIVDGKEMVLDSPLAKNTFFIACNILAQKFCDDSYMTNKYFSKMYKMPLIYMNEIEVLAYRILGWNLYLSDAVIAQMGAALAECITSEK